MRELDDDATRAVVAIQRLQAAYADAVAERAACYQDSDTTCEAIAFGFACTVSGE